MTESIVTTIGELVGVVVLKRLKFQDTTLIAISYVSLTAQSVIIGLAHTTWMMYVACAAALLGYMAVPAYKSFTTTLVEPNEVGKVMAILGIAESFGVLFAMAVLNNLYIATLHLYAGFVFLVVAGILILCMLAMVVVHIFNKRDDVRGKMEQSVEQRVLNSNK
ncbi:MAG: hypothetical protein GY696_17580 [Gammaproteobacteria bacterium]|nr:hypothetical protein [Gammaproteobacteria bacterium]